MNKFFVVSGTVIVIAIAGFFVWKDSARIPSIIDSDPHSYVLGTVNAEIQIPSGWTYSTDENKEYAAFHSPNFRRTNGSNDPFGSFEEAGIETGAALIIPLFPYEEIAPAPVGTVVTLDGSEGDVVHGRDEDANPPNEYDRLRVLHEDGVRYVLLALEYAPGYRDARQIMDTIVSSFVYLEE